MLNATLWLELASSGYCAASRGPGATSGDCRSGDMGNFGLPEHAKTSWAAAADWCLGSCDACARCRYIDVSIDFGRCAWHHACDESSLHIDLHPAILSGPAPRTLRSEATRRERRPARRGLPAGVFEPVSPELYAPEPCSSAELRRGAHTAMTKWSAMGTGFNMMAAASALHRAACCGGSAVLPRLRTLASKRRAHEAQGHGRFGHAGHLRLAELLGNRGRGCTSFRRVPRVAPAARGRFDPCAPMAQAGWDYFPWANFESAHGQSGTLGVCPSKAHYWRPAMLALLSYVNLYASLPPCSASKVDFDDTLVVHVRSGDLFKSHKGHPDHGASEAWSEAGSAAPKKREYAPSSSQPPLAFVLGAWADSRRRNLLVVTESADSPVVKMLRLLEGTVVGGGRLRVQAGGESDFRTDLGTLMCARHLALSKSSMNLLLLTNPRLETVYTSYPLGEWEQTPIWSASCGTAVRVARNLSMISVWTDSAAQRLEMAQGHWEARVEFDDAKLHCLGLNASAAASDASASRAASWADAPKARYPAQAAPTGPKDLPGPGGAPLPTGRRSGSQQCEPASGRQGRPGFCHRTSDRGARLPTQSCKSEGPRGPRALGSWKQVQTADECLALCSRCAACKHVSYSHELGDCSWFATCDVTRLRHAFGTDHCTY